MPKWEYLFVSSEVSRDHWRPKYLNGDLIPDWEQQPVIHDYCNQLGAQEWELVNIVLERDLLLSPPCYRLIFKRHRPE